jgi:hypothetical protein
MGAAGTLGIPGICPRIFYLMIPWLGDVRECEAGSNTGRSLFAVAEQRGDGFPKLLW